MRIKVLNSTFFFFLWYINFGDNMLEKVYKLKELYDNGLLGGEILPEDNNPNLDKDSIENIIYFTLPMALNYQRNSYKLWESALKSWNDKNTRFIFNVDEVLKRDFYEVQEALIKYRLALQKDKQTKIWIKICKTIKYNFNGDIRNLFIECNYDVEKIRKYMQIDNKKDFPYLSGLKLCDYWMYVMYIYCDIKFINIDKIRVATDSHVCRSTFKLGLINEEEYNSSNVQNIVIKRWNNLLEDTDIKMIDISNALWLWSRNNFSVDL